MPTMKAVVLHAAGGPEALTFEDRPVPTPQPGEVLIRVKAFGLNRSDAFMRRGVFAHITLPRILGIEAVGIVQDAPGGEFRRGDVVATAMGGMAWKYDGSYAEFTCVPARQIQALKTDLPWATLGAVPELLQTAWGSLFKSLRLEKGERLLIRGGSTSVGLAAAAIANNHGAYVSATTPNSAHQALLRSSGVEQVFIDTASIAEQVHEVYPGGVDKVLAFLWTSTMRDSLLCTKQRGIVCITGMIGDQFAFHDFSPMDVIPTAVHLTCYTGGAEEFMETPLQELLDQISAGTLHIPTGTPYPFDEIVAAHTAMDEDKAGGKIVMLMS